MVGFLFWCNFCGEKENDPYLKRSVWYSILFLVGCSLIFLADPISSSSERSFDKMESGAKFAEALDLKTERTIRLIRETQKEIRLHGPRRVHTMNAGKLKELFTQEGILLFVYRNDRLILWSDNSLSAESARRAAALGTEIIHFDNGWYRLVYFTDGVDEFVGAILLSRTYPYKNEYLHEGFTEDFRQRNLSAIKLKAEKGSVKLKADHQSFYLVFSTEGGSEKKEALLYVTSALTGGILVLLSILLFYGKFSARARPYLSFPVLVSAIVILRYLSLNAGWPSVTSNLSLFDPSLYASSFLSPNLADFIINISLLALLSFYARRGMKNARHGNGETKYIAAFLVGCIPYFFLAAWINQMAKELVINSSIPFDIYNINQLSSASIPGIASLGVLYFSAFLISDGLANFASKKRIGFGYAVLGVVVLIAGWVFATHAVGIRDLAFVLWPGLLLLFSVYLRLGLKNRSLQLIDGTVLLLIFSSLGAYNIHKYTKVREHDQRRILAEKLAINDDPIAEVLFADIEVELIRDPDIKQLFEQEELHSRETLEDYVVSRYFTGYWSRYNITLHAFNGDESVWGKLPARRPSTFDVLENKLREYGDVDDLKRGFHFLYNSPDRTVYLAMVPLRYSLSEKPDGFMVFEFTSTLFPQQVGFPNLLIDRDVDRREQEEDYSTARYIDRRLVTGRGDYSYPLEPRIFEEQLRTDNEFFSLRGYEHFVSKFDEGDFVVISKERSAPLDNITMVTYLCIIFAILFGIGLAVRRLSTERSLFRLNLNRKIQLLLVTLAATIMVLFSLATKYYIENKYREKNERLISEKMQSILLELENKLGEEEILNYDMADYLNRLLSRFSVIFFTDINLYDPEGNLVASSQMRMFNEGLISRKMDPSAFVHLNYLDQVQFVQEESVGELSYISAYSPLLNEAGELIGYTNLPYFARQTELTNEISSFLVSVINLFVLVFVLSLILALFISQWITLPLRSIRESLAAIDLGKSNRLVGYQGKDEIGRLVDEYNAKVAELEINAEKLSQTEREMAWREMAKQVAHEIKNPLTPMKLSVQHLERSLLQEGKPDREKVNRMMQNLVEQIDTLSSIAGAFSNFAKMPKAKVEKVDLEKTVESALHLFKGFDRVEFDLHGNSGQSKYIMADRDQLIRVFNNLIKNAIQSIPDERKGKVDLSLNEANGYYIITVSDNGVGISEEKKSKIFVPNFTTKTRGMGLGLAISKNIIENFGGSISFESEPEKGSVFTVKLPKA